MMDEKPPLLHRDDIPMELAEDLVDHLKELHGGDGIRVQFIGDLTDKERTKLPQEMIDAHAKLHEHFIKCFIGGLCHVCGAKFPGEWPPTDEENWSLQGWVYYDTDSEGQPPVLACPDCEKQDSDGQPRPVETP